MMVRRGVGKKSTKSRRSSDFERVLYLLAVLYHRGKRRLWVGGVAGYSTLRRESALYSTERVQHPYGCHDSHSRTKARLLTAEFALFLLQ